MEGKIAVHYFQYDLPDNLEISGDIAVDTEAMGLNNHRDRLCMVQIGNGRGDAYLVHFPEKKFHCPNLKKLLRKGDIQKIFHFGRFDIAIIYHYLGVSLKNVFCTKIASRLSRTYTDKHGLKDLCHELLGVKLNKAEQTSYWGGSALTDDQLNYAASDVMYLHNLRDQLLAHLEREDRLQLAQQCFKFLPTRAKLDVLGWPDYDIFQH